MRLRFGFCAVVGIRCAALTNVSTDLFLCHSQLHFYT